MKRYLYCDRTFEDEDFIWFCACPHNGIYKIDKKTQKMTLAARFPGEKGYAFRLYRAGVPWRDRLVFAPCAAKEIAVLDCKRGVVKKIPLRRMTENEKDPMAALKFWDAVVYRDEVYFLGTNYPAIVCLNLLTEELTYYTDWVKWIEPRAGDQRYLSGGVIRGRYAYLGYFWAGAVLRLDLENHSMETIELATKVKGFCEVADDGEDLWFAPRGCGNVVRWNPDSGEVRETEIPYIKKKDCDVPFCVPLIDEDKVYLFPAELDEVYVIDRETGIASLEENITETLGIGGEDAGGTGTGVFNPRLVSLGRFCYISGRDFSWHAYDAETGADRKQYWEADGEDCNYIEEALIRELAEAHVILSENQETTLPGFLRYIKNS